MMLFGRVEIVLVERFNSCNFIRAPIESRRLSSLEHCKSSLSKLTIFSIELGRDFTSLHDRSKSFQMCPFLAALLKGYDFCTRKIQLLQLYKSTD